MNTLPLLFQQAPAQPGGIGGFIGPLLPMILIFAVFYFLIIVPQRRRQRELQATIANLKAGDRIVTSGGIIATVTAVRDTSLIVRSADKTMLEIARSSVAGMQAEEEKK
ncbi:MAG TPA: preprotein translocase subunit YajC [Pyrinomonadaceae bacterium]|jgi:preprotein translocase subunit YajC